MCPTKSSRPTPPPRLSWLLVKLFGASSKTSCFLTFEQMVCKNAAMTWNLSRQARVCTKIPNGSCKRCPAPQTGPTQTLVQPTKSSAKPLSNNSKQCQWLNVLSVRPTQPSRSNSSLRCQPQGIFVQWFHTLFFLDFLTQRSHNFLRRTSTGLWCLRILVQRPRDGAARNCG